MSSAALSTGPKFHSPLKPKLSESNHLQRCHSSPRTPFIRKTKLPSLSLNPGRRQICLSTTPKKYTYKHGPVAVRAQFHDELTGPEEQAEFSTGTIWPYVCVACLGAILTGYNIGVVNVALGYLAKDLGFAESIRLQVWVLSTTILGATIGSLICYVLVEKHGRRRTFQLDAILLVIGALLSATAKSIITIIIGQLFTGIGIGISSSVVPLYIFEISPNEIRGALGSLNHLCIWMGLLVGLVAGLPLARHPLWWRNIFVTAILPAVLMALGMAFSPESPHWLVEQGKSADAERAIETLWGKGKVEDTMIELKESGNAQVVEEEVSWLDLFRKHYLKVGFGATLILFQQLLGVNVVVFYSASLFRRHRMAYSIESGILVVASTVIGSIVASLLMDKTERKNLLIASFLGMAASILLIYLSIWRSLQSYWADIVAVGTILYVVAYSLGVGPFPSVLLPEIFDSGLRTKGVTLLMALHWVLNFLIGVYFLRGVNKIAPKYILLGACSLCLASVYCLRNHMTEDLRFNNEPSTEDLKLKIGHLKEDIMFKFGEGVQNIKHWILGLIL